jgi:hypothetical protein
MAFDGCKRRGTMMRSCAIMVAAATAALPSVGAAATFIVTYSGKVRSGVDNTGVFGGGPRLLDGQAFTVSYTLSNPAPSEIVSNTPNLYKVNGGTIFGGSGAPVSAILTIGGVSFQIIGSRQSEFERMKVPHFEKIRDVAFSFTDINGLREANSVYTTLSGNSNLMTSAFPGNPYSVSTLPNGLNNDNSGFEISKITGRSSSSLGVLVNDAYGTFDVTGISQRGVSTVPGIPEPATWAMMILGFGVVGSAMRRRTPVTVRYA